VTLLQHRGLRLLGALGALAALASPATAVPPAPVDQLPCPGVAMPERTVLLAAPPSVPLPADAREWGGVPQLGLRVAVLPTEERARAAAGELARLPLVRSAEVDRRVTAHQAPNDPLLPNQWALRSVRAPAAWDVETGRRNPVLVAVLDTGVDSTHPDLMGHVRSGGDFIDGDADPTDNHFHGTSVSGIVAATTNNRRGVAGVSWGATVLAERVLSSEGSGSMCTVAVGMVDAVDAGARVLNLSLGGPGNGCPFVLDQALSYAHDHGALTVVSAGNDGAKGNPVNYPAGCAGAFAVAATDRYDRAAKFSEHGPQVDISAPGVDMVTTYVSPAGLAGYAYVSGTSASAPLVSGAAALLLSRHPAWTPDQVRAQLEKTSRDLGPRGRDDRFGAGLLDVGRALR
jgi:subtilisin family serine protease